MGISDRITSYEQNIRQNWDNLVAESTLGSVIHKRIFMEHHKDRFQDRSLCFWNREELIAVIPGTSDGFTWSSHAGLTYGGFISRGNNPSELVQLSLELLNYLTNQGYRRARITLPSTSFCQESVALQSYALQNSGFELTEVHLNQVFDHQKVLPKKKIQNARTATNKGIKISDGRSHLREVYEIIFQNLVTKYGRNPTHSLDELSYLIGKFPVDIKVYSASLGSQILGGAITFNSNRCINLQYLGVSEFGKRIRAQDLLLFSLINECAGNKKHFSFGKSTSGNNADLNENLYKFKSEFSASPEEIRVFEKILRE
jgi:hypothetical protein